MKWDLYCLITNFFHSVSVSALAKTNNNWDNLYGHINKCMEVIGTDKKPNFIAVDFIGSAGDLKMITEFYNDGGIIFYEGNDSTKDIVCGLSGKKSRNSRSGHHGCENDEARSAKIFNTAKGTKFSVYDDPEGPQQSADWFGFGKLDDFSVITVIKDVGSGGCLVPTFEKKYSSDCFRMEYFKKDGLYKKVSYFSVQPPED